MPATAYRLNRRGRVAVFAVPVLAGLSLYLWLAAAGSFEIGGIETGQLIGAETPPVSVTVDGDWSRVRAELNGTPAAIDSDTGLVAFPALEDGEHTLEVTYDRRSPFPDLVHGRRFVVDGTAPDLSILEPSLPVEVSSELTVAGLVDDPLVELSVGGVDVPVEPDGAFSVTLDQGSARTVEVVATDSVGNTTSTSLSFVWALPGASGQAPIRGVHATGYTWVTASLREPILEMVADGLINTIEIDLKDESGFIWYDTDVALAHEIGAVEELFVLEEVVAELHDLGVRVVGRIVNFRDPILAEYAVANDELDWLVLDRNGAPFQQYGGFTNPFNERVREYNVALAEEAVARGVDDVLLDYVRRPDAPLSSMQFPGQDGTPEDAIISFLAETQDRIGVMGGRLGASVFGIAATRPEEIGQDIPGMAEHVDYVAPMVYPSHWGAGEYDVADPNRQPYEIVYRSLLDFVLATEGSDASVVAWLQDFSLGATYGPDEVRAQIEAAADAGVADFLLWDPSATYTVDGLQPAR